MPCTYINERKGANQASTVLEIWARNQYGVLVIQARVVARVGKPLLLTWLLARLEKHSFKCLSFVSFSPGSLLCRLPGCPQDTGAGDKRGKRCSWRLVSNSQSSRMWRVKGTAFFVTFLQLPLRGAALSSVCLKGIPAPTLFKTSWDETRVWVPGDWDCS